jgi:hypothetical protein
MNKICVTVPQQECELTPPLLTQFSLLLCRFGGVEATTFCCLSALYEQMQIDKQVDVFLHASLCQQARPNVWRKQDDFLFLYKTLTGLELDVGTWSKKRYSYAMNIKAQQQNRPALTEVGGYHQAAMNMSYGAMSVSSTLGPGFRSHQQYQMASVGLVCHHCFHFVPITY